MASDVEAALLFCIDLVFFMFALISVFWDLTKLVFFTFYAYVEAVFLLWFPPELKSLAGEIILITGAANGIGREICIRLAESKSNAILVCWDIDRDGNQVLLNDLTELGAEAYVFQVDVSDREKVESTATYVKDEIGSVTMIMNYAGIMPCHSFLSHNPRELERLYKINVLGQCWVLREFLPKMIKDGRGHIVTICSVTGLTPWRNLVPYCGVSHAVQGSVEALKEEIRHSPEKPDIKFTTVYPFFCSTDFVGEVNCYSRFPFLLPMLDPRDVAIKLVDGVRQNYEHVYIPRVIQFFGVFAKCLLPNVQRKAADFFDGHVEPIQ